VPSEIVEENGMSCGSCATQTAKAVAQRIGAPVATGMTVAEIDAGRAAFQAKYGGTFTREKFCLSEPDADGKFVLKPSPNEPLPPLGCRIKVYGYSPDKMWRTSVVAVDQDTGTFTAQVEDGALPVQSIFKPNPYAGNPHKATATFTTYNGQPSIEIRFPVQPPDSVLADLHRVGFKWSRPQRKWYALCNGNTEDFARDLIRAM
jgi:hypothetical protein